MNEKYLRIVAQYQLSIRPVRLSSGALVYLCHSVNHTGSLDRWNLKRDNSAHSIQASIDYFINGRLETLRKAINAGNISTGEIVELQGLIPFIDSGDVQLLEWAGGSGKEITGTRGEIILK